MSGHPLRRMAELLSMKVYLHTLNFNILRKMTLLAKDGKDHTLMCSALSSILPFLDISPAYRILFKLDIINTFTMQLIL